MGADIHIYAEQRLNDGTWAMCKAFGFEALTAMRIRPGLENKDRFPWLSHRVRMRHYEFFGALAGVRAPGPKAKGLPKDVSPWVQHRFTLDSSDAHTPSWYSAREFVPIFFEHHLSEQERTDLVAAKVEGEEFDHIRHILENYIGVDVPYGANDRPDIDALRFVFWFDN